MVVRAESRSQSGRGGHERHSLLRQCVATMKCDSMNRVIRMLLEVAGNSQAPAADDVIWHLARAGKPWNKCPENSHLAFESQPSLVS